MVTKLQWVKQYRSRRNVFSYYRRDGQSIKIVGEPGSVEWLENYNRIHASFEKPNHDSSGTLSALIQAYKVSPEFAQLAPRTRSDYDGLMKLLDDQFSTAASRRRTAIEKIQYRRAYPPGAWQRKWSVGFSTRERLEEAISRTVADLARCVGTPALRASS